MTNLEKKEMELGDVLFSLVNYARISGINPDSALERMNNQTKRIKNLTFQLSNPDSRLPFFSFF
jgi:uncharacterized protein YabN with tetrapyrrole methylase and pyrophosphatase domain